MKKTLFSVTILLLAASFLWGCGAYTLSPAFGALYTDVKAPWSITGNSGDAKVGMASCTSIFGLIATGDASIQTAAKNAGITKIHHVDFQSKNILGIYAEFTTVVYGE